MNKPRRCWFKIGSVLFPGMLHMFAQDHEEYETGPGPIPVGIVEDETGKLHSIHVKLITFDDPS